MNRFYAASPASYDCLKNSSGGTTQHQVYIREYRRDRIRDSTIWPYCPECYGWYTQSEVISYELSSSSCLYSVGGGCGIGRKPFCFELCSTFNIPCN